jgi:hypothetical protein
MKISKSIDIATQADKIWPFLIEPDSVMKWCCNVKRIILHANERNHGLGGKFYLEERAVGRILKLHFVVTEFEVNRSFAFKMVSGDLVKAYEQKYTLEPHPNGTTLTCFEHVIFPMGIMGKAAGMFRKPISEARVNKMLANLKIMGEV